jgi:hypothetical protein
MNSEFSFYQFTDTPSFDCDVSLPVYTASSLAFFVDFSIDSIKYVGVDLHVIGTAENVQYGADNKYAQLTDELDGIFYEGTCFRLLLISEGIEYYSTLLRYKESKTDIAILEYRCNEAQFGFDYSVSPLNNKVSIPIRIFNPQFPQADKVYVKSNGERSVQFSKIDKEWKLETEYLTAELHEKIIVALAHDTVIIDGESVTKSAEYEINWDDYVEHDCSGRLSKATCKVQQNRTLRNSNCK